MEAELIGSIATRNEPRYTPARLETATRPELSDDIMRWLGMFPYPEDWVAPEPGPKLAERPEGISDELWRWLSE